MHDAVLMSGLQRGRYALLQDLDFGERKRSRAQPFLERRSFHELHRQIGALKLWIDREYEIAHDRIVRETVEDRGLAAEEVQDLGVIRKLWPDHLDRDWVSRLDVEAAIDL